MNSKVEYGIQGAFKVDLFSGGKFHSTTDWFNNFITPTGLMYPATYPFADCFRFLSIGTSSTAHQGSTGIGVGTTGLVSPIPSFTDSNGQVQPGTYIDWQGYATGTTNSNCGTVLTETGPRFYRAWYLPTGREEVFMNEPGGGGGLSISEFMVSPSSGTNATGKYAFSRVLRNLFIPNGFRALVSYQLKVNVRNTGASYFGPGSFATGNAEVSNDAALVARWANLDGAYRQVYFGLRCIDNYGMTYIPRFGDGMEPSSRNLSKMVWYLSPDNSQFDVNGLGGSQDTIANAYRADGLMFHIGRQETSLNLKNVTSVSLDSNSTPDKATLDSYYYNTNLDILTNVPDTSAIKSFTDNIRLGNSTSLLELPQLSDYSEFSEDNSSTINYQTSMDVDGMQISYATPGVNQFSTFFTDFGKQAAFASNTTRLPFTTGNGNDISTRKKTLTRRSTFSPVASLGYNTRFGSLVYAFEAETLADGQKRYWPMIDAMFKDSSGQFLLPHYRYISGIHLTERGTGVLDGSLYLSGSGTNGNINKFTTHRTFQGGYDANLQHGARWVQVYDGGGGNTGAAGFLVSGTLNTNASGVTGITLNGTGFSGWGAVYGVTVESNFYTLEPDSGLYKRSTGDLTERNTGQLYWPYTQDPFGIKLYGSGFKYWTPEFDRTVIIDNAGYYGPRQILEDINFDVQDLSFNPIAPTSYPHNVSGFTGFFLSTGRYYNQEIPWSGILVSGATPFALTGYVCPAARNTANQLKGSSWVDTAGALPSNTFSFAPKMTTYTLSGVSNAVRVSGLFVTEGERGFPNGTGTAFATDDKVIVFFTGFSGNPAGGGRGLYLTYVSGNGGKMFANSILSGVVSLTNFRPPTGYAQHGEVNGAVGRRLGVNFAPANIDINNNIYTAISGGEYPALSMDNGLEMYLDISWSSPCGASVLAGTCNEPT
jgi:hypothetical protein